MGYPFSTYFLFSLCTPASADRKRLDAAAAIIVRAGEEFVTVQHEVHRAFLA
jgi:hypothetical protein